MQRASSFRSTITRAIVFILPVVAAVFAAWFLMATKPSNHNLNGMCIVLLF